MLMPETVVLAVLSALSVTVPVTDWLAPLPVRVVGAVALFTPEVASAGVNDTVTSVLFQPLALAAGVREPPMVGAVLSRLTGTGALVALLPTLSVTVVVRVTVPSVVTVALAGLRVLTPEPAVVVARPVTVTSDLFQLAPFGVGLRRRSPSVLRCRGRTTPSGRGRLFVALPVHLLLPAL